ncbi:MAG: glycosyltransferase [Thermodesulfobacteriota bacterium]
MLKILFITSATHTPGDRNFNHFQRVYFLSRHTDLTILACKGASFAASAKPGTKIVHAPWSGKAGLLLYGFFRILAGKAREFDIVLTEPTILGILGFLCKLVGRCKWVVDIWDIPIRCNLRTGALVKMRCRITRNVFINLYKWADLFIISILPDFELREFNLPAGKMLPLPNAIWVEQQNETLIRLRRTKSNGNNPPSPPFTKGGNKLNPLLKKGGKPSGPPLGKGDTGGFLVETPSPHAPLWRKEAREDINGKFNIICMRSVHTADMGLDTLAQAFLLLQQKIENLSLTIIGRIPKHVRPQVAAIEKSRNVRLVDFVEHEKLKEMIKNSFAAVIPFKDVPDLAQTHPIKVLEYMSQGAVVVASNIAGISRVIEDGKNGLLFKPGDAEDLADKILTLHGDEKLRMTLAKNAIKIDEQYDCVKKNEKIVKALEKLAAN